MPDREDCIALDVASLPRVLRLERVDEHRYAGRQEQAVEGRSAIFGGQILAQMIMAAHLDRNDGKEVKSIHAVFARAGDHARPIEYEVERMHDGRTFGSDTVTLAQAGKIMSRGLILWNGDEPDLVRHTEHVEMPKVVGPDDPATRADGRVFPGAEARIVTGPDARNDGGSPPPARRDVWTRYSSNHSIPVNQAILSWATDGYLIGTALLPHEGYDESQAHRSLATGVVAHTVNFHDRFRADEWLLLDNESIWAGRGRSHGRCNIWTREGRLVATYAQDSLIRAQGGGADPQASPSPAGAGPS